MSLAHAWKCLLISYDIFKLEYYLVTKSDIFQEYLILEEIVIKG